MLLRAILLLFYSDPVRLPSFIVSEFDVDTVSNFTVKFSPAFDSQRGRFLSRSGYLVEIKQRSGSRWVAL